MRPFESDQVRTIGLVEIILDHMNYTACPAEFTERTILVHAYEDV